MREQFDEAPEETWLGTWGPLQPTETERRMDPRVVATDGDEVVVQYTTRALAPNGERFASLVLGLYEVRDGKFARAQMFHYDTAGNGLPRAGRGFRDGRGGLAVRHRSWSGQSSPRPAVTVRPARVSNPIIAGVSMPNASNPRRNYGE